LFKRLQQLGKIVVPDPILSKFSEYGMVTALQEVLAEAFALQMLVSPPPQSAFT
jgi:hypothetical protein